MNLFLLRSMVVIAFVGAAWGGGYSSGARSVRTEVADRTAKMQLEIIEASARAARTGAALQAMRATNASALEEFKNDATNNNSAGDRRVDPDSLRRLKALFQRNRAPTR